MLQFGIMEVVITITRTRYYATFIDNNSDFACSLFWTCMAAPGSTNTAPHGALKSKIDQDFGSFDTMVEKFNQAAATRFGSGWAWLAVNAEGKLAITSTPNQGDLCALSVLQTETIDTCLIL